MHDQSETLFATKDLSRVRTMLEREWARVHSGRTPLADFVFNKEVKVLYPLVS